MARSAYSSHSIAQESHASEVHTSDGFPHNRCAKFIPITSYIGINFGAGALGFGSVTFYADDVCKEQIGQPYNQSNSGGMGCPNTTVYAGVAGTMIVNNP